MIGALTFGLAGFREPNETASDRFVNKTNPRSRVYISISFSNNFEYPVHAACFEMSEVTVLYDGYSEMNTEEEYKMLANCSCTLIKGEHNIIVDTMTAWDSEKILSALDKVNIKPDDISYVISTHGHSDHIGNNNLFLKAKHIVGFSVSFKDTYYLHPFEKGREYVINESVKVIPTPGHTMSDVTVIVQNKSDEIIAITGDLFECYADIEKPSLWIEAGSENRVFQKTNRSKVSEMADWIVPGHGKMFQVTEDIRKLLHRQANEIFL